MPQQYFVNFRIHIPEEQFDLAYGALNDFDLAGIEERDDELLISFADADVPTLQDELCRAFEGYGVVAVFLSAERIEQKDWSAMWEQSLQPVIVSDRIVITPRWCADETAAEIVIVIDPKMSFGTGYHATTRMVSRLLESSVKKKSSWIDIGCGTGVLAILAAKLGASRVIAFDNDVWAVENAVESVENNNVVDLVIVKQADIFTEPLETCDGICANLYRNLLLPNLGKMRDSLRSPDSFCLLSGVLKYDTDEIVQTALTAGFQLVKVEAEDDWVAIQLVRGNG